LKDFDIDAAFAFAANEWVAITTFISGVFVTSCQDGGTSCSFSVGSSGHHHITSQIFPLFASEFPYLSS